MDLLPKKYHAPELYGDYWFNSDPIPMGALRGYTVLLHFWDYTCLSCVRSLPYIHEWHKRYGDKGLVVIGVHTPEYPFARDPVNVRRAIDKLNIKYPVVMDNEFMIWGAYRTRVWPTKYLVDRHGFIRVAHEGEGSYQSFEQTIQSLLAEAGYHAEFPLLMEPIRESDRPGAICYRVTPEIFGGYQRGSVGNVEGSVPESTSHFEDPHFYLEGRLYLQGNWQNSRSYLKLEEEEGREGYLTVMYKAKEVNIVVKPEGEKKFQVFIQQNGQYLIAENKGSDVRIDAEGRSFILVTEPKLYNIVSNPEYGEFTLRLSSRSPGFALYSMSFVSCLIPELIPGN